ncbi:MAG: Flp pilus assembly protein CpaB [Bryobacteraceae bacterium]|jgi:pilus assembly protein CpaB
MNKRFVGVLIFAFVVATAGGLITYKSLMSRSQAAKAAEPSIQVVLASKDLELGAVLKEGDLYLADWSGALPAGASNKLSDLYGRGVTTPIYAKEPVIDSRLAPKGAGGGLAAMIPKGMRAFTIPVNEVVGVAGFVTAGQHVDLLISGNSPGGNGSLGTLSRTLLQNLEILSAGQDFKKDPEGKPMAVQVVNVLVTPEQAEILSLATGQTSIRMVLRNPLDHEVAKTPGTNLAYMWGTAGKGLKPAPAMDEPEVAKPRRAPAPKPVAMVALPPPPAKKEVPFNMEIISGTSKTEVKFDKSGEGK